MRRREVITLLGGAAAACPGVVTAQQRSRQRIIGVLMLYSQNDPQSTNRMTILQSGLEQLGWTSGRDIRIEYRWEISNNENADAAVADLLALSPDVILAVATPALRAAQKATRAVPIVFIAVSEPVAQGFVASLASPGGNITGFTNLEPTIGGKWLELLKEIAPGITRVAFMYNPDTGGIAEASLHVASSAAPKFALSTITAPVRVPSDFEPTMSMLAREIGTGLLIPLDTFSSAHYKMVVELAARHRLPGIYPIRQFATAGGLISYGPDIPDQYRRAVTYINKILRGERPANLPVQQPTKYELVINARTARTLGLVLPDKLLTLADEVID